MKVFAHLVVLAGIVAVAASLWPLIGPYSASVAGVLLIAYGLVFVDVEDAE